MPQDTIMKYEPTLPADFDGVFRFTNWSDKEFIGVWNKMEYHFPPEATSPMIIPEHSPLEIQHIRKKFAKDLAEREYFRSKEYELIRAPEGSLGNRTMSGIHTAATYSLDDLKENIQKCLKPLELKKASMTVKESNNIESTLSRNDDGELNTKALSGKESLKARAMEGQGLPK